MSNSEQNPAPLASPAWHPARLRIWLILVTILSVIGLVLTIPAAFFGTYMAAFAADAPGTPADAVVNLMVAVWGIAAGFAVLLIAGIVGGWIAYRRKRPRLAFGLSLLAAVPILLIILAVLAIVVTSFVWTASIQSVPSTIP